MKKREIRKLASELYKEGKTRQETFDVLIKKIKKPITYTADVLKYYPPNSTRKKYKILYWLLFTLITISELILITCYDKIPSELGERVVSFKTSYDVFFHKSFFINDLIWIWIGNIFGGVSLSLNVYYVFPALLWTISLLIIIINHLKYNLNHLYMIIFYYLYSSILYLLPSIYYFYLIYEKLIGIDHFNLPDNWLINISFISFILSITILTITIFLKRKVAPKYQKVQTAYLNKTGVKRMKLMIKFND